MSKLCIMLNECIIAKSSLKRCIKVEWSWMCNTAGNFYESVLFFEPLRREKINLTIKNTAVLHNFLLSFSSANPLSVHTWIDLVFMDLPSSKPEELQITVSTTNNPLLLEACCPVNIYPQFSLLTEQDWHSPVYSGRLEYNILLTFTLPTPVHWCTIWGYWNFRLEFVTHTS